MTPEQKKTVDFQLGLMICPPLSKKQRSFIDCVIDRMIKQARIEGIKEGFEAARDTLLNKAIPGRYDTYKNVDEYFSDKGLIDNG